MSDFSICTQPAISISRKLREPTRFSKQKYFPRLSILFKYPLPCTLPVSTIPGASPDAEFAGEIYPDLGAAIPWLQIPVVRAG